MCQSICLPLVSKFTSIVYRFIINAIAILTAENLLPQLHWRHNDQDGVPNHQPHGCLLNRLFRRRLKKPSKLRVIGLYVGNSLRPLNSPHIGPVTRKMFPFDDVIMRLSCTKADHILSWAYLSQVKLQARRKGINYPSNQNESIAA